MLKSATNALCSLRPLALAVAIMTIGMCGVAAAQDTTVMSASVYKGDLDLSTAEGAQAMLQRIRTTVARLCDDPDLAPYFLGTGQHATDVQQCRAEALGRAVTSLGAAPLTAEYEREQDVQSVIALSR
jgi:UrcA family protein